MHRASLEPRPDTVSVSPPLSENARRVYKLNRDQRKKNNEGGVPSSTTRKKFKIESVHSLLHSLTFLCECTYGIGFVFSKANVDSKSMATTIE